MTRNKRAKVAVIIPTYNDGARLTNCLQALSRQTYPMDRVRVYVADNNSSENIRQIVAPFDFVNYIFEPKPGAYCARNAALMALLDETVVGFTDADCIPAPDWIEQGVEILADKPESAVGGAVEVYMEPNSRRSAAALYEFLFAFPQKVYVEKNHFAVTANLFMTRSALDKVGKFDETLFSGGDAAYGNAMREHQVTLIFSDEVRVSHPARDTVSKLTSKVKRTVGGCYSQRDNNPFMKESFSALSLMRGFVPPVRALKQLLLEKNGLSFLEKVRVAWLLVYLKYHKNLIKFGYKFGFINNYERF